MEKTALITVALSGFVVAFFHAAIPTHWLPFVLTARAQKWTHAKTLIVTTSAGAGHVTFTALLGLLLTLFGFALHEKAGQWFPRIAGASLLLFGLVYLYRQFTGKEHGHSRAIGEDPRVHAAHHHHDHAHGHGETGQSAQGIDELPGTKAAVSDRIAITSLFALLTFSPCESFVPFYVYGMRYGWIGFGLLTGILSIGTVAGMVLFTWLSLVGMQRLNLRRLEEYEVGLMGVLLAFVGLLIIVLEK